jgi:hypothetical protein
MKPRYEVFFDGRMTVVRADSSKEARELAQEVFEVTFKKGDRVLIDKVK